VRLALGRHPMHPPPHLMMLAASKTRTSEHPQDTDTAIPTYNNASRTRRTPPTPDDASRMQYSHKTRATSSGPGPIVII